MGRHWRRAWVGLILTLLATVSIVAGTPLVVYEGSDGWGQVLIVLGALSVLALAAWTAAQFADTDPVPGIRAATVASLGQLGKESAATQISSFHTARSDALLMLSKGMAAGALAFLTTLLVTPFETQFEPSTEATNVPTPAPVSQAGEQESDAGETELDYAAPVAIAAVVFLSLALLSWGLAHRFRRGALEDLVMIASQP